jgi:hypothetical protein
VSATAEDENMKNSDVSQSQPASELISKRIAELGDWRGETLGRMRRLIKEADPDVVEEWKWMGTPVWSHDGIICTGESYKNVVKLTFAKGASLKDRAGLFNASLDGNARRAIDIHEGEDIDESAFKALVLQAGALNSSRKSKSRPGRGAAAEAADVFVTEMSLASGLGEDYGQVRLDEFWGARVHAEPNAHEVLGRNPAGTDERGVVRSRHSCA